MTTLVPRLYVVDKATQALTPIDGWAKLELGPVRNEAGAVTVEMASGAPGFDTLFAGIDAATNKDVEFEAHVAGSATGRFRGFLQEKAGDDVAPGQRWTFSGGFLELLFGEALVYPGTGGAFNSKGELAFAGVSPGTVLITAVQLAQARSGVLTGVTWDFTASVDSAGAAWATSLTNLTYAPGTSLAQIAAQLVGELQAIEWEITASRVLRAWNAGTRGVDRTGGDTPLRFQEAVNLGQASRRESSRTPASGTAVLVKGADGFYGQASDASAQAARGRRVEVAADAGNITTQSALNAAASTQMQIKKIGTAGYEYQVAMGAGLPAPRVDFEIGDSGYCAVAQKFVKRRVSQYVLTFERGKPPAAVVALNDLIVDPLVALYRKLNALTSGAAVAGTSTTDPGADTTTPNAPTGVTASSSAFLDGPYVQSIVTVGWTPPTQNTDGSAYNDVGGYRVEIQPASGGPWRQVVDIAGSASSVSFDATPGSVLSIRVLTYDTSGHSSAFANLAGTHTVAIYTATVPVPSTPVAADYLGTVLGTWDGKDSSGAAMPLNVQVNGYVEVHMSTSSTFTPVAPTPTAPGATFQSRLYGPGRFAISDLTYNVGVFFKLVAVDSAGNRSNPSASSAVATPAPAGNIDIGAVSAGKITTGNLSAAVALTGSITAGTPGAGRTEQDSGGMRIYNTAGTQIGLLGTAGYNWLTGELRTALSGSRMVVNPNGSNPDRMDFYPTSGTANASIESQTVAGQAAISAYATPGGNGGVMLVRRDYASLIYGAKDASYVGSDIFVNPNNARISASVVDLAVDSRTATADGTPQRVVFSVYDSSRTTKPQSWLWYCAAPSGDPWLRAPNQDVGFTWGGGIAYVVANAITTKRNLFCDTLYFYSQVNSSSRTRKRDIRPADHVDMRTALRAARPMRYHRWDRDDDGAEEIGLIAEDMPPELQALVTDLDGRQWPGIQTYGALALLWGHVGDLTEEVDALRADLARARRPELAAVA